MSKEKLILFSVKYTGTHFVSGALVLHSAISFPIQDFDNDSIGIKTKKEFNSDLEALLVNDEVVYTISTELGKIGFEIVPKKNIIYQLFQFHYFGNYDDGWMNNAKVVIPIREPLKSYISAMKRGWFENYQYFAGFEYISQLKNAFYFPVDMWQKNKALQLYEFLKLEPTESCIRYLTQYPCYGSIEDEPWRKKYFLGSEYVEELNICEEMFRNNDIHRFLMLPIKILRSLNLETFYRTLGYKDLLWYA